MEKYWSISDKSSCLHLILQLQVINHFTSQTREGFIHVLTNEECLLPIWNQSITLHWYSNYDNESRKKQNCEITMVHAKFIWLSWGSKNKPAKRYKDSASMCTRFTPAEKIYGPLPSKALWASISNSAATWEIMACISLPCSWLSEPSLPEAAGLSIKQRISSLVTEWWIYRDSFCFVISEAHK